MRFRHLFLTILKHVGVLLATSVVVACTSNTYQPGGSSTVYVDPNKQGGTSGPGVSGLGIESQDIISMTDEMMRDMLSNPSLAGRSTPPRILLDSSEFDNEGSQAINKNMITSRLRVGLNRASQGRMMFVSQKNADAVQRQRNLKRDGMTDQGTVGLTEAQAGIDYMLVGAITDITSRDSKSGQLQRYNQITFEMMDVENGILVWSGIYEFAKSGRDDVQYR
jgi:PBP1b-binding outer membrane lipoprotein LpoB